MDEAVQGGASGRGQAPQAASGVCGEGAWGSWVSVPVRSGLTVRTVRVKPRESLALEYLEFRSAHWFIMQGWAEIVLAGVTKTAFAGDRLAIPARMPHRMRNLGAFTLTVVQVQTREPLHESEIIRLAEAHGAA